MGEKDLHTYKRWFDAGADRYLLRHETANPCHYASLHPPQMSSEHRKECLRNLKAIGYQTGCGIMVGAPYQTTEHIAEDLEFMYGLQPEMVGIGPFIPHHDTPFKDRPAGTLRQTPVSYTHLGGSPIYWRKCLSCPERFYCSPAASIIFWELI